MNPQFNSPVIEGLSLRSPESCPLRLTTSRDASVVCDLLSQLLSGGPADTAEVSADVCSGCCRSFLPTVRDWNPVIASRVWSCAEQMLSASNDQQPDHDHWMQLMMQAERCLPPVLPDEEDLPLTSTGASDPDGSRTIEDIVSVLPLPSQRVGRVTQWAVGVTTAPRRAATLLPCLQSLIAAGWAEPHLFIDGAVDLPAPYTELPRTYRQPAIGARQSYYLAVVELLQRHPEADAVMLVQDDAYWPGSLPVREYLEQALWPGDVPGLVSGWCCTDDTCDVAGWHHRKTPWKFGAVVFIFSRDAAERFVHDSAMKTACDSRTDNPSGGLSMLIGDWAARCEVPVYFPTPSLVQHLGDVSTIWEHSRAVGVRRASRFLGDEVLESRPP